MVEEDFPKRRWLPRWQDEASPLSFGAGAPRYMGPFRINYGSSTLGANNERPEQPGGAPSGRCIRA